VNKGLIVELAQFKLADGVDEQSFLRAADAVQEDFLRKQDGYIDRELLKGEDNQWLDILHWSSLEEAQQASEAMLQAPSAAGFMQAIDPTSVKMMHLETVKAWDK
jgi:heme-degrading monooxygenase HmoA